MTRVMLKRNAKRDRCSLALKLECVQRSRLGACLLDLASSNERLARGHEFFRPLQEGAREVGLVRAGWEPLYA
jgi:hypothetical protein